MTITVLWILVMLISALVTAAKAWPKRQQPGGGWFVLTMLAASLTFTLGLWHERMHTPPLNYLTYQLMIVALTTTVYGMFVFIALYLGYTKIITGRMRYVVLGTYLFTVLGNLTNGWHGFMYITAGNCELLFDSLCQLVVKPSGIIEEGAGHHISSTIGFLGHFWSVGAISSIAFAVSKPNRQRLLLLGVAYCLPILPLLNSSQALSKSWPDINLHSLSYALSLSVVLLLFYRFNLLDTPLAAWNRRNVESSSPVLCVTPDGHLIELNPTAAELFQATNTNQLLHDLCPALAHKSAEVHLGGRIYRADYEPSELRNAGTMITLTDMTERVRQAQALQRTNEALQEAQASLHHQAYHDALTGLYNRRQMDETLNECAQTGTPLCVILGDVDDFRTVNGQFGLTGGDEALKQMAQRIQQQFPPPAVPCRYGGEEFCILLPNVPPAVAQEQARRLLNTIRQEPYTLGGTQVKLSLSLGTSDSLSSGYDKLLVAADQSLRTAKMGGKDQVVSRDPRPLWRRGWFS